MAKREKLIADAVPDVFLVVRLLLLLPVQRERSKQASICNQLAKLHLIEILSQSLHEKPLEELKSSGE